MSHKSYLVLSKFRFDYSSGANADSGIQRQQEIVRVHPLEDINSSQLLNEFKQLLSEIYTFVNNWNCPDIDPNTYRLYDSGKNA